MSQLLTPAQQQFLELSQKYEALKEEMKQIKPELDNLMSTIGVGSYFQDPATRLVYKITEPKGTFVEFSRVGYERTKRDDERRGTLSKKEAQEAGFDL